MFCVRGPRRRTGRIARAGVDGQPEPKHLFGTAEPGAQFVQLQVWEVQMAEEAFVQGLSVRARARQPGGDGRLPVAEDPFGGGNIQSTSRALSAPLRPAERGFSDGRGECGAGQ
jgi:hypothetical protein